MRTNGTRPPVQKRTPPHDLDAEEALLGAMMLATEAVDAAAETVTAESFYKPAHGHIYAAICSLNATGQPIDPVAVADQLRRDGLLDQAGGHQALVDIMSAAPSTTGAPGYARIIGDHAIMRGLIAAGGEIAELGYRLPHDVDTTLDQAESLVFGLSSHHVRADKLCDIDDVLGDVLDTVEHLASTDGEQFTGVATGYRDLDQVLLGLQPSALTVIAARPAMGKTSFTLGAAAHVATTLRRPVLYVSLEMSRLELTQRLVAMTGRFDLQHLRSGNMRDADWHQLSIAVARLGGAPLVIDDDPLATIGSVRAKARRVLARRDDLALVIVDYLQLMRSRERTENRQLEVAAFARELKTLARELEVPVLALSQVSRSVELRADKRPTLADVRESGEIENSADVVAFVYRDEIYYPDSPARGIAELIVAKHRNGPTATVKLAFIGPSTLFANMARTVPQP